MSNKSFDSYSQIYDAFYSDKNYANECDNLISLARAITPDLKRGIEIGAGSGAFTRELVKTIDQIDAFELSPTMADICANNLVDIKNVKVHQGNLAQTFNSGIEQNSIDLVVANFHVFTYFTGTEAEQFFDLCKTFLRSGGVVAFDFWDLDAVLLNPPTQVIKVADHGEQKITRKTFPNVLDNFKKIEVNFEFFEHSEFLFKETHYMYPRSLSEVKVLFKDNFEFCGSFDITTGDAYSQNSYGNLVFFRKA